ncbi:SusD/RagB family nutrient-binding outer membrane lipoprotein [Echinicola strongylocentroti]|uniref:SusD/RagB family nutrient-binding outer membrane lipoprotein n=1 Tax=Echinicola strongylocentroti TaxID=1795355 RepID=A0A2Z4ICY1_9BACT|nr:SusD/RagB family nutrient-binding outer membrane lipoprotein [Echinicola strongylocentroti]AWW28832.1 SusD/RagB family nutrient-binding outer membrane lipoprotein [Echinicola strongylocentroti]
MYTNRLNFTYMLAICLLGFACTADFEDINTDSKRPVATTPDLLLPGIIKSTASAWGARGGEEGLVVTQHAGEIQSTNDDTYRWNPNPQPYTDGYNTLRDVYNLIDVSQDTEGFSSYYGIGLVLKCWNYQFITDAYGDIPYLEAVQGKTAGNFFPAFTPQKEIYQGMIDDLVLANQVLAREGISISGDILYAGDLMKWRKFANSLRLRLLMRISDADPGAAQAGIREIVADPETFPVFESNDDMAALQHDIENPPSRYTTRVGSFDSYRLSRTLEQRLKAMNDPRLKVFAQPISASGKNIYSEHWDDYAGIQNGLSADESESYSPTDDPSKSGSNFISRLGILYACQECNTLSSPVAAQTVIMTYSEVAFLIAEAIQREILPSGNAEEHYQKGIRASFDYYADRTAVGGWDNITNALMSLDMESYLSQENVGFSGNPTANLQKIYLQKWISQFYTGMEAWSQWRRTNQPEVIPGPDAANDQKVPVRFLYPNEIKATNSRNYESAVLNMGGDYLTTRLWWDIADNQ